MDNPSIRNLLISFVSTSNRLPRKATPDSRKYKANRISLQLIGNTYILCTQPMIAIQIAHFIDRHHLTPPTAYIDPHVM